MKARTEKRIGRHMLVAGAVVALTMALSAGVAFAGINTSATDGTATLNGGDLTISSALQAGTFGGTLTGAAQVLNANGAGGGTAFSGFSINDPRGIGVGWNVTMQATPFDNGTVAGKDIAPNSLRAPLFAVVGDEGSSALPGALHAAASIDTGSTGVVMAACDAGGQGMGTYDFTAVENAPWTLALTADEYAGIYTSTVTTTVATLSLPALYGFSPASGSAGAEGTLVTLTGINFTDATAVAFNGTTAVNMTVVNDTHITVTVPEGATTGKIVVFGPGGTLTSATDFTVNGS